MLCAVSLAAAGCGGNNEVPLALGSVPPSESTASPADAPASTTTTTGSSTTAAPQFGPWTDVTANLAGMPAECGNMYYVVAHPARDQLIAGIAGGGLWANNAGTSEWTPLGTGAGSAQILNRTDSIVFDPENPDRFWQSGHYGGGGAFRTDDGGPTFVQLGDVTHLDGMSVDLTDPERRTLLAGTHERAELLRSTDGGATWTNLAPNLPAGIGVTSQVLVIDSQVHLVGTNNSESAGIFRTADGGTTWTQVATGGVRGAPLVSSDGTIYWITSGGDVMRSTDAGQTWTNLATGGQLASSRMIELPDGRLASVSSRFVIVSADGGEVWRNLGPPLVTQGAYGLTHSAARRALYTWQYDCGEVVPAGSVQRLDLPPGA